MKAIQDPRYTQKKRDETGTLVHNKLRRFVRKFYKEDFKKFKGTVPELENLHYTDKLAVDFYNEMHFDTPSATGCHQFAFPISKIC